MNPDPFARAERLATLAAPIVGALVGAHNGNDRDYDEDGVIERALELAELLEHAAIARVVTKESRR